MSERKKPAGGKKRRPPSELEPSPVPPLGAGLRAIAFRAVIFAVFLVISGLVLTAYRRLTLPVKPLHTFSSSERASFAVSLKAARVPQNVWIACPDGKVEICGLVAQFVPMFQDSGWKVEANRVITWKPSHPLEGVHLILRAGGTPDNAAASDPAILKSAFTALGIPVQVASAPDVPGNSIGIFFGPDL